MSKKKEKPATMNHAEIIAQIENEYQESYQFVQTKRDFYKKCWRLYYNNKKALMEKKVGITLLYRAINTLLSIYYSDEVLVKFTSRGNIGLEEKISNLNKIAAFDYDEMGKDVLDFWKDFDRLFYGVSIQCIEGWDENTKTPIVTSRSPLYWLPDPKGDGVNGMRFQGFEYSITQAELEAPGKGFMNIKELHETKQSEMADLRQDQANTAGYGSTDTPFGVSPNKAFDVVDWFTYLKTTGGDLRKFLITLGNNRKTLIRLEELPAVTEEEKADPSKIPDPFVYYYYSPIKGDPFGMSVCHLDEDKQRAISKFVNLMLDKEESTLYPMRFFNSTVMRGRVDLSYKPNKWIPVTADPGAVAAIVPTEKNSNSSFNMVELLTAEAQISTGVDETAQGIADGKATLGENQQAQSNANLIFALSSKVKNWGEKRFYKLWIRQYKKHFKETDEKLVIIKSGTSSSAKTFKKDDFITKEDPHIQIELASEKKVKQNQEYNKFLPLLSLILQDPKASEFSKTFAKRKMYALSGISQEEIDVLLPQTYDERTAVLENELLERDEESSVNITDDHLSHLVLHGQVSDTAQKKAHMAAHSQMYQASLERQSQELLQEKQQGMQTQTPVNPTAAQVNPRQPNQIISNDSPAPVNDSPDAIQPTT